MIKRGDIYRIGKEKDIVVCITEQPKYAEIGVNAMVVGGSSKTYPQGGYDIFVFYKDLQAGVKIEIP